MSLELHYTSAPKGLKPGSQGYCTVAATLGIPPTITQLLESISGYQHLFSPSDPSAALNPVAFSHLLIPFSRRTVSVISRVSFAGLDHTDRTNNHAHHVALEDRERPEGGPAWLASQPDFLQSSWQDEPTQIPEGPEIPSGDGAPGVCERWGELTGDPGWGGVVASALLEQPQRPIILVFKPGMELLPLFEEAIALLPRERRWGVTFCTYAGSLPHNLPCQLRGVVAGTKEVEELRRLPNALFLDLTQPLGAAPETPLTEPARTGEVPEPSETPDPSPMDRPRRSASAKAARTTDRALSLPDEPEPDQYGLLPKIPPPTSWKTPRKGSAVKPSKSKFVPIAAAVIAANLLLLTVVLFVFTPTPEPTPEPKVEAKAKAKKKPKPVPPPVEVAKEETATPALTEPTKAETPKPEEIKVVTPDPNPPKSTQEPAPPPEIKKPPPELKYAYLGNIPSEETTDSTLATKIELADSETGTLKLLGLPGDGEWDSLEDRLEVFALTKKPLNKFGRTDEPIAVFQTKAKQIQITWGRLNWDNEAVQGTARALSDAVLVLERPADQPNTYWLLRKHLAQPPLLLSTMKDETPDPPKITNQKQKGKAKPSPTRVTTTDLSAQIDWKAADGLRPGPKLRITDAEIELDTPPRIVLKAESGDRAKGVLKLEDQAIPEVQFDLSLKAASNGSKPNDQADFSVIQLKITPGLEKLSEVGDQLRKLKEEVEAQLKAEPNKKLTKEQAQGLARAKQVLPILDRLVRPGRGSGAEGNSWKGRVVANLHFKLGFQDKIADGVDFEVARFGFETPKP